MCLFSHAFGKADKKKRKKSTPSSEASAENPPKKKKDTISIKHKNDVLQDAREAAYTTWPISSVQIAVAAAETIASAIGAGVNGVFPMQDLKELTTKIPEQVLETAPELQAAMESVAKEETIPNHTARGLRNQIGALCEKVEKFYASAAEKTSSTK